MSPEKRGKRKSKKDQGIQEKDQRWNQPLVQEMLETGGVERFVRAGRLPTISGKGLIGGREAHFIQVPPVGISVFLHEEVNIAGNVVYLDERNERHIALQCEATPEQVLELDHRITEEIIRMIEEGVLPTRGRSKEQAIQELRENLKKRS